MTKEQLAARLNGREYRNEISKQESEEAAKSGFVVVFGASDDLMEFRGAIHEELGAWNGATVYIAKKGGEWAVIEEEEYHSFLTALEEMGIALPYAHEITAEWAPEESKYSWLINTEIPHATFDIMEDGELYCRGIVFSVNDLGAKSDTITDKGNTNVLQSLASVNATRSEQAFGLKVEDWNLTDWACALAGEVGELCNFVKKQHLDGKDRTEEIAREAADIVVYLDLLCKRAGIDLQKAIIEKFNHVSSVRGVDIFI